MVHVCVCDWMLTFSTIGQMNGHTAIPSEKTSCCIEAFLLFIPWYHRAVYYFNRPSTCTVEQNKRIANFLWAKWKQSLTAKPWLIYHFKLKLYYQSLGFADGWKGHCTFSWFAPRADLGQMETQKWGRFLCHAKGTCTSPSICTSFDP